MAKYLSYNGLTRVVNYIKGLLNGTTAITPNLGTGTKSNGTVIDDGLSMLQNIEPDGQSSWCLDGDFGASSIYTSYLSIGDITTFFDNDGQHFTWSGDDFTGGMHFVCGISKEADGEYDLNQDIYFGGEIQFGVDMVANNNGLTWFGDPINDGLNMLAALEQAGSTDWVLNGCLKADNFYFPTTAGFTSITALATAVGNKVNTSDTIAVAHGGTGATTAAGARTNLGIGTVGTLSYGSGTTTFLRNDGTWATPSHYTSYLYATNSSTGTSNVNSVTNGNLRLNLVENGSVRSTRLIKGVGGATVTTDASGNIVVTGKVGTTTDTTFVPLAT